MNREIANFDKEQSPPREKKKFVSKNIRIMTVFLNHLKNFYNYDYNKICKCIAENLNL